MCIYGPPVYVYFVVLLYWLLFPPNTEYCDTSSGKERVYAFVLGVKMEIYIMVFFYFFLA